MVARPEPSPGLLRRLDDLARAALPALAAAFLMILAAGPTGIPALAPAVVLPCVVFWSIHCPGAMSPPAVFVLGLLQDLLTLAPLGIGVVTLLAAHGLALTWRRGLMRAGFPLGLGRFLPLCRRRGRARPGADSAARLVAAAGCAGRPSGGARGGALPPVAFLLSRLHAMMARAEKAP